MEKSPKISQSSSWRFSNSSSKCSRKEKQSILTRNSWLPLPKENSPKSKSTSWPDLPRNSETPKSLKSKALVYMFNWLKSI